MKSLFLNLLLLIFIASNIFCNTNSRMNSFQFYPLGLLSGSFAMNYELLLFQQHGLVFEFRIKPFELPYSIFNIQYRYHFKQSMDSFFLGGFCRYSFDKIQYYDFINKTNISYTNNSLTIGVTFGYKWVFDNGISICLRAGGGYPIYFDKIMPESNEFVQTILNIFDGEISIGYSF